MDSNLIDKMKLNLDNNLINKKNKINNLLLPLFIATY